MKVAEIIEANKPLMKDFKSAGISAELYKRPPIRKQVFTIGVEDNKLRIWPGDGVALTAKFDPSRHQAVLKVDETERSFPVRASVWVNHTGIDRHMEWKNRFHRYEMTCDPMACRTVQAQILNDVRTRWSLPKEATIVIDKAEWGRQADTSEASYTATVTVPSTVTSFLVGIDETSHFVSQLPDHPSSVATAHRTLRPSVVPDNSLRQGEWFFTPCSDAEIKTINAAIIANEHTGGSQGRDSWTWRGPRKVNPGFTQLESGSSHRVVVGIKIGTERYANVMVYDDREGRHAPLPLPGWHRVTRNTEVVQAAPRRNQRRQSARWD